MKHIHIRYWIAVLVSVLILCTLPALAESGEPIASGTCSADGSVTWSLSADYVLTISGKGAMNNYGGMAYQIRPWHNYRSQITAIIVEEGVTDISGRAFYYCSIATTAELADSVVSIGSDAFEGCTMLESVTMPANLKTIGDQAFRKCTALTGITLPNKVESLGSRAFYNSGLTTIHLPASLKTIGSEAFVGSSLSDVTGGTGLVSIDAKAFEKTAITQFIMPDTVTSLGSAVFNGCASLETVRLSNGLTEIPGTLFQNCKSLKTIEVPSSVESIGTWAFNACSKLETLVLPENLTVIPDRMASSCSKLVNVNIPDTVTEFGAYAFYNAKFACELELNENLTRIGEYAFYGTSVCGELDLPAMLTEIGQYAFYNAKITGKIELPAGLTTLGQYAFYNCKLTGHIEIPAAITEIGAYTFYDADLSGVTFNEGLVSIGNHAFDSNWITGVTLPGTTKHVYAAAFQFNRIENLSLNEGLETLGNSAFNANRALKKVTIPSTVTTFGTWVFAQCGLTEIEWPAQLTEIPKRTFYNNDDLVSFDVPSHVTVIGEEAFSKCYSLESITLPAGLKTIGASAFSYSAKIQSLSIPAGVTSIGSQAFANTSMDSLHIPSTVTGISADILQGALKHGANSSYTYSRYGYYYWPMLTTDGPGDVFDFIVASGHDYMRTDMPFHYTVDAAGNATITRYLGEDKECVIPPTVDGHTVTTIGSSAFIRLGVKRVTLPDTVTTLQDNAFEHMFYYNCSVDVPASVVSIAESAFRDLQFAPGESSNDICIRTTRDSAAHKYAIANKIRVVCTDKVYDYTVTGDTCTLTGYYGEARVALPSQIDGYTLTAIGENAFADAYVEHVIIPDTVKSVGANAFYNVMFPDRLSVCFPESVTTFGKNIFRTGNETDTPVYLVFDSAAYHHFWEAGGVWQRLWDGVSFEYGEYTDYQGNSFGYAIYGYVGLDKDITLPTTAGGHELTIIAEGAFPSGYPLNSVTVPEGYTTIKGGSDGYAFLSDSVKHVYLPRSISNIERVAFLIDQYGNGPILHAYTNSYAHQRAVERDWNFELIDAATIYSYEETADGIVITGFDPTGSPAVIRVPETIGGKNVVGIAAGVFTGSGRTHIVLPDTVTSIGDGAFAGVCEDAKTHIEIRSEKVTFGAAVFDENSVIFSLPDDDAAAYAAQNDIDHKPTAGTCENFVYELRPQEYSYAISKYTGAEAHVTYPAELFGYPVIIVSNYDTNKNVTHVTLPENVQSISGMTGFVNLRQIDLPETLTSIAEYTFRYCEKLDSITLPSSLKSIGAAALEQCRRVICHAIDVEFTSYDILADDVTVYGYTGCSLKNFTDAVGGTFVNLSKAKISEDGLFIYSVSDKKVTITDYVGESPEVEIPSAIGGYPVKTIGASAFAKSHVTNVLVPGSVTSFGNYAFRGTVTDEPLILRVPKSVKTFGKKPYPVRDLYLIAPEDSAVIENAIDNDKCDYYYFSSDLEFSYDCWFTDSDKRVIEGISGYWGTDDHVTLPEMHGGVKATVVYWNTTSEWVRPVESYTIPEGYVTVVSRAFRDGSAKDIYLPRSLTDFGGGSFPKTGTTLHVYCNSVAHAKAMEYGYKYVLIDGAELYDYTIIDGECTINAYKGDYMDVVIPSEIDGYPVTTIGTNAFSGTGVTYVTLPESVTNFGNGAFTDIWAEGGTIVDASRVNSVTMGSNVFDDDVLLATAAAADNGLYLYASQNDVRYVKITCFIDGFHVNFDRGSWIITGYYGEEEDLFVPAELGGLPVSECRGIVNEHIRRITFSDKIPVISSCVVQKCPELVEVNLPANMTGEICMAFGSCPKLDYVIIPEGVKLIQSMLGVENIIVLGMNTELDYPIMPAPANVYAYPNSKAHQFCKYDDAEVNYVAITKLDTMATPLALTLLPMTIEAETPTEMDKVLYPANGAAQTWTSSNPAVATVENGIVSGHSDGTASITVTIGDKSSTAVVTVRTPLRDFALAAEAADIAVGQTLALGEVSRVPAAASDAITYTVSDSSVLKVDASGNVTALKTGEATLTATSANGIVRTCKVSVFDLVTALTLSHSRLEIPAFESAQLTATVTSGSKTLTNRMVNFTSSNEDVAVVSADGIVTLVGNGPAVITATAVGNDAITAQCEIIVTGYVNAASLSITGADCTGVNSTAQLKAVILPEEASDRRVQWSSSDDAIATVDRDGNVKGIAEGTVTITAIHRDGLTATFTIAVKPQATDMALDFSNVVLASDGLFSKICLQAVFSPDGAMPENIQWTSSDEHVLTVDADGLVNAHGTGYATVTGTSANGLSAICRVTVKEALVALQLPKDVQVIEEEAFCDMTQLEAIVVPDGVMTIGARAFAGCTNLRFVVLPDSLTGIAPDAFDGCGNLFIVCPADSPASAFADAAGVSWSNKTR